MKRFWAVALCLVLALSACAFASAESEKVTYRTLYSGEVSTLNYLKTSTTNEFTIAANVVDTLIEHDRYGQLVPCLATDWETSEDGCTWTFHLRQDAKWVTSAGEYYADVTAEDFITAAKYVLDANNASSTSWILTDYILGAEAYNEATGAGEAADFETVGIKALDTYTVAYTTAEPCPYFLTMLDYVCYMPVNAQFLEEVGENFGVASSAENLLYCGPYVISVLKPQEKRVYTKNESYWDKDHVYIDVIDQTFNAEASTLSSEMYLRGEIDAADISTAVATAWLADPEKAALIHPVRQYGQYSYFWTFNFDANFDADYEPENWTKAVNNETFRKSILFALNRVRSKSAIEPNTPEDLLWDTIMPEGICVNNGLDYTDTGALADLEIVYDVDKAQACKAVAMAELTEAGATFPVKVLMPYNPSSTGWANECLIVEQMLEEALGTDYIDIIVEPGPSSGFLSAVRRSGNYALLKCNWGLDFDDPVNLTEPFKETNNYNFFINATDPALLAEDGTLTYYQLLNAAKAMPGDDVNARYEAFAEAEAYLIEHAIVLPYGSDNGGYTASRLNTFEGQFGATGLASCRYKGMHLLDKPMSTSDYYEAYLEWLDERDALIDAE
ncbi:MAG: peptide ABC transporter substrate-binding protein [Clostridia bacterium]|nr:peptide ABC transporter substrate-binding protein [Clostridia bacterium]